MIINRFRLLPMSSDTARQHYVILNNPHGGVGVNEHKAIYCDIISNDLKGYPVYCCLIRLGVFVNSQIMSIFLRTSFYIKDMENVIIHLSFTISDSIKSIELTMHLGEIFYFINFVYI